MANKWLNENGSTVSVTPATNCHTQSQWHKPKAGWIKCNYDDSFVNHNGGSTAAWILRDENGIYKGAAQATGVQVTSAFEAECQSLILAMQHLWIKGYRKVIFEGDCKLLVNVLSGKSLKFDAINWINEIKAWGLKFEVIEFIWSHRSTNQPADILARSQRRAVSSYLFHNYVPICISHALFLDYIGFE